MAISRAQMPSQLRGNRMEEKAGFDSTGDDARDLEIIRMGKGGKTKKKKKSKSRVNEAGNYTKPGMRKRLFNRIKAGGKGGAPGQWSARKAQMLAQAYKKAGGKGGAPGQWSARKAQMLASAYKKAGGGYKN